MKQFLKDLRNFFRQLVNFGMADLYNKEPQKAPNYCVASGDPCEPYEP